LRGEKSTSITLGFAAKDAVAIERKEKIHRCAKCGLELKCPDCDTGPLYCRTCGNTIKHPAEHNFTCPVCFSNLGRKRYGLKR